MKKRKGLLAFYVGTGVVALLFVGFYFAWTPLRIWYHERELTRYLQDVTKQSGWYLYSHRGGYITSPGRKGPTPRTRALAHLMAMGTEARPAIARCFRAAPPWMRVVLLDFLQFHHEPWTLPIVVEHANGKERAVALKAMDTAEQLAQQSFYPAGPRWVPYKGKGGGRTGRDITEEELRGARKNLLDWWNREGRAKYGRGLE